MNTWAHLQGIEKLEGEINITLKPNAIPYVAPVHRVAHSLQEPLKKELDRLVQEDIIVPLGTDKPSEWCNSFVCIPKPNGKIRLCLDPTQLIKLLPTPTMMLNWLRTYYQNFQMPRYSVYWMLVHHFL